MTLGCYKNNNNKINFVATDSESQRAEKHETGLTATKEEDLIHEKNVKVK